MVILEHSAQVERTLNWDNSGIQSQSTFCEASTIYINQSIYHLNENNSFGSGLWKDIILSFGYSVSCCLSTIIYFCILRCINICYFQCSFGVLCYWVVVGLWRKQRTWWVWWSDISVCVPMACLSLLSFVKQSNVSKPFLKQLFQNINLPSENHSCISISEREKEFYA